MMNRRHYQPKQLMQRLLLSIGFVLAFIWMGSRYPTFEHQSRQGLMTVGAPFIYVVSLPGRFFNWLEASVSTKQELIKQNMELKSKNLLYQANLQQLMTAQNENKALQSLMTSSKGAFAKVEVARLLSVASNPYRKLIVLNKGTQAGVFVHQAVLDSHGIVGQVIEVGPMTSVVLLINDSESVTPVKFLKNGERGFLAGDGQRLSLMDIAKTMPVEKGDILISSGLGQRFPKGYPVGVVEDVKKEPGEPFLTISVTPSAGLSSSELFLLVWPNKQQKVLHEQFVSRYQHR